MTGAFLSHRSLSGCPRVSLTNSSTTAFSARKLEELTTTVTRLNFKSMGPTNGFHSSFPDEVASPSHEDIRLLEDEIFELQEFSSKVEQDINRMKMDTHQLQNQTKMMERVCVTMSAAFSQLSDFLFVLIGE